MFKALNTVVRYPSLTLLACVLTALSLASAQGQPTQAPIVYASVPTMALAPLAVAQPTATPLPTEVPVPTDIPTAAPTEMPPTEVPVVVQQVIVQREVIVWTPTPLPPPPPEPTLVPVVIEAVPPSDLPQPGEPGFAESFGPAPADNCQFVGALNCPVPQTDTGNTWDNAIDTGQDFVNQAVDVTQGQ